MKLVWIAHLWIIYLLVVAFYDATQADLAGVTDKFKSILIMFLLLKLYARKDNK